MVTPVKISFTGVCVDYGNHNGAPGALRNVTAEFNGGDRILLIGLNGSGKSTLLKVIAGIADFTGNATANGVPYSTWLRDEAQPVCYVPQDIGDAIGGNVTLRELMTIVAHGHHFDVLDDGAREWIADNSNKLVSELSGGQRQYVVSAIALAHSVPILLLDEVFRSLDLTVAARYNFFR